MMHYLRNVSCFTTLTYIVKKVNEGFIVEAIFGPLSPLHHLTSEQAVVRAKPEQLSTRDSLLCITSLELVDKLLKYD